MEVRSEGVQVRFDKIRGTTVIPKSRLRIWFIRVCSSIVIWTCLVQLVAVAELWHPHILSGLTSRFVQTHLRLESAVVPLPPASKSVSLMCI